MIILAVPCPDKNSVNDERAQIVKSFESRQMTMHSTLKNNSLFRYIKYCFDTQNEDIYNLFPL